jgi:hypothetical protein
VWKALSSGDLSALVPEAVMVVFFSPCGLLA